MEELAALIEQAISSKLRPLEEELELQQSQLRELIDTVAHLSSVKGPLKSFSRTLSNPKTADKQRQETLKKAEEEPKPARSLKSSFSTHSLRSDKSKTSPFPEGEESKSKLPKQSLVRTNSLKKSESAIKLSHAPKKSGRVSLTQLKESDENDLAEAATTTPVEETKVVVEEKKATVDYSGQIEELLKKHRKADLERVPEFELTTGAKSALLLANTLTDQELFLDSEAPESTINVFRLFFQFQGSPLPSDNSEAWSVVQEFIKSALSEDFEQRLLQVAQEQFVFSDANIEAIAALHAKVSETFKDGLSSFAAYLMFLIQEALNYSGVCSNPAPWRIYRRLQYQQSLVK